MIDKYIYVVVALLPLTALMLVLQSNPYQALVVRAILGAVAALVYATLGGADVALTEALVGTMLATTLYIIAVRSSLVMRLGVVNYQNIEQDNHFDEFILNIKRAINPYHLRLEIVDYKNSQALEQALLEKEIHTSCTKLESNDNQAFKTKTRIKRLFEILQEKKLLDQSILEHQIVPSLEEKS